MASAFPVMEASDFPDTALDIEATPATAACVPWRRSTTRIHQLTTKTLPSTIAPPFPRGCTGTAEQALASPNLLSRRPSLHGAQSERGHQMLLVDSLFGGEVSDGSCHL